MNLLQISASIHEMPFNSLLAVLSFGAIALAVVFIHGITLKLGDKEINIGGLKKIFAKRDADIAVKDQLKKQIDGIDSEMLADVQDAADSMNSRFEAVLINKHCWFTLDKFIGLIKKELYKRIRRNNLKVKLCEENRANYVTRILGEVREQYQVLQMKAASADCHEQYGDFSLIEEDSKKEIEYFFDEAKKIVIRRLREKIALYEKAQEQFQTKELRRQSCEIPMQKNREYIANLEAV